MHESLQTYAAALGVSEGHVQRHIRNRLIPSAICVESGFGRPHWEIRDTSPEAIRCLRDRLRLQRYRRRRLPREPWATPSIPEDGIPDCPQTKWVEAPSPVAPDPVDRVLAHCQRLARWRHGLLPVDERQYLISAKPTRQNSTADEERRTIIARAARFEERLVSAVMLPPGRFVREWILRHMKRYEAIGEFRDASTRLAIHNATGTIKATAANLAKLMGISRRSLYRIYGSAAVKAAIRQPRPSRSVGSSQEREMFIDRKGHVIDDAHRFFADHPSPPRH